MAKVQDWHGNIIEDLEMIRKFTYGRVGKGWHSLLDEIFAALPEEATVIQVKEKFGGLRFYVSVNESEEALEVIRIAEAKSYRICEVCGKPGECKASNHWLQTLCPTHREEVDAGKRKWEYER